MSQKFGGAVAPPPVDIGRAWL